MDIGTVLFFFFSFLALVGAVGLISSRHPVNTVLFLVLNFFAIGGLYLTLSAEFLAVVQVIVYAGAIMVLFMFVVMLLNLQKEDMDVVRIDRQRGLSFLVGFVFLGLMLYVLRGVGNIDLISTGTEMAHSGPAYSAAGQSFAFGKAEPIGRLLMTDYLFPFEMISVVLLSALMGAVVIAKKHN